MQPTHFTRKKRIKGVALIEVLVAILLFALGVLALVGLQGALTRAQTDSKVRTDAATLASELIGQMWGDIKDIKKYDSANCTSHARCTSWKNKVADILPSGSAVVSVNDSTGDVSITMTWTSPSGDNRQYQTQTTLLEAN